MTITKRTKVPGKDDKKYILTSSGGEYGGIAGKPSYFTGSGLGNCVCYAYNRRREIEEELTGQDSTKAGLNSSTKNKPTSAYAWYGIDDGYERSTDTPKVGSVVCFKKSGSNSGHVAIVEEIGSNYIVISESGNGSYIFRTCKIYKNYCNITAYNIKTGKYETTKHYNYKYKDGKISKTDYNLQGYIYPPQTDEFEVGDKVKLISKGYIRYILKIDETKAKPYKIGTKKGAVTGWYTASQIEKVEE